MWLSALACQCPTSIPCNSVIIPWNLVGHTDLQDLQVSCLTSFSTLLALLQQIHFRLHAYYDWVIELNITQHSERQCEKDEARYFYEKPMKSKRKSWWIQFVERKGCQLWSGEDNAQYEE